MADYSLHGYDMTGQERWFYVFVSADGRRVKVGMVCREDRLGPRLAEVTRRSVEPGLRQAAAVALDGMNEHEAEDTEAAIRTWLARATGLRHTGLVDWLAAPVQTDDQWKHQLKMAAAAVTAWGNPSSPSNISESEVPAVPDDANTMPLTALLDRIVAPTAQEASQVASAIDGLLATPGLQGLITDFFDPGGTFASETFDLMQPGPPNKITVADLLAVTLMDVTVQPRAVRLILGEDADVISRRLTDIEHSIDLWDASDEHLAWALAAWDHLAGYDGVGQVIAGKLLARKRPRMIPVIDSITRTVLRLPPDKGWTSLRAALADPTRRRSVEDLRPPAATEEVSTLRLLDACAWMRGSNASSVRAARDRHGVPPSAAP